MTKDTHSMNTSVEISDAAVVDSWSWSKSRKHPGGKGGHDSRGRTKSSTRIQVHVEAGGQYPTEEQETFLGRLWRYWSERAINSRLTDYEEAESKAIVRQRLQKVDQIFADEEIKKLLVRRLMCPKNQRLLDEPLKTLRHKYGYFRAGMSEWLLERAKHAEFGANLFHHRMPKHSFIAMENTLMATNADEETLTLKLTDPLAHWFQQKTDVSSRMMARIQNLASAISGKIKWSWLLDPGRPQTDLANFFSEFDILEVLFDKVDLSAAETSQRAFDANPSKTRNRKLECVDWSRVKLTTPEELTRAGTTCEDMAAIQRRPQPADIFGDLDCPQISQRNESGHGDFIHASYVTGGPLLNKFILTQAPLGNTIPDFWRMVWQEKSEYIYMLCDACETDSQGLMSAFIPNQCPCYWPRYEGEIRQFGRLIVKNERLDATTDPLFNVTHLVLWLEDEPADRLRVQHWQWDWRTFTDFYWPLRLLIRSRQSKRPTIVQCMDGCGRSGTLVLLELALMQLLRGSTSCENPMITSAVFLRLQRRHAVSSHIQYLFAYRVVLHWLQPFVVSSYHRFVLGFMFSSSGFLGKYDQIATSFSRRGDF